MRGTFSLQSNCNEFEHPVCIADHVVVPKPKDTIVVVFKPSIAHTILLTVCVLPAIDFDDQPTFATDKVDDIRTDRLLAYKLAAIDRA